MNICYSDLHVHTNRSFCAPSTSKADIYLPYCEDEGVRILGLVNHLYLPEHLKRRGIEAKSGAEYAAGLRKEFENITVNENIKVLFGCEAETLYNREPSLSREESSMFDYVLLAPSHICNLPWAYEDVDYSTPKKLRDLILEQFKRACMLDYDAPVGICHPLYPICSPWEQEVVDGITHAELEECFTLAAERNVSIEVHACLYRDGVELDEDGLAPSYLRILEVAKDCGCKFHFGSDAHEPNAFIGSHKKLELAAKRLGLKEEDLWEVIH